MLEAGSGSIIHGISSIWGWLDEFGLGKWKACYKGIILEDSGREVSGREMVGANAGQLWVDEMAWFWGQASSDLPSVRFRAGCHLYFIHSSVIAITLIGYNTSGRRLIVCAGKCQKEVWVCLDWVMASLKCQIDTISMGAHPDEAGHLSKPQHLIKVWNLHIFYLKLSKCVMIVNTLSAWLDLESPWKHNSKVYLWGFLHEV